MTDQDRGKFTSPSKPTTHFKKERLSTMRSICSCIFFISLSFTSYGLKIPSSQIHKIRNYNDNFERLTPCVKAQLKESVDISVQENFDYASELKRTGLWVASAAGFAGIIGATKGIDSAVEFCSGYLLEQCLSVDNLFVFIVLFEYFKVTKDKQDRVLSFGIWGAVVLRGIFVAAGAATLQQFHQILLLFSAILAYSSYKVLFAGDDDEEEDISENAVVKLARKFLKTTDQFDGEKFFTVVDGVKLATPLLLCLVCVELSDVVFAFDSVPAVFGVTQDPLIVYSSNIFAIAGLRSLFGVLSNAMSQLQYLEKAVGLVLGVIATKLAAETFDIEILSPLQSLLVVGGILGVAIGLSLASPPAADATDIDVLESK